MDRIAFVVPRFGSEAGGGAETECMETARRLKEIYKVDILTSCASDYVNWNNRYDEGSYEDKGLTIKRFLVEDQPDAAAFESIKVRVYSDEDHSDEDELMWAKCRGPYCPSLIRYIQHNHEVYKAIFYASYPWYTSIAGLLLNYSNSIFMPMAHDERQIYLTIFKKVFHNARAYIFNTQIERRLVCNLFDIKERPYKICGMAVETRADADKWLPEHLPDKYILYAGRISDSKNISELFKFFIEYKRLHNDQVHLVVIGKADREYQVPFSPYIHYLGYVNEEVKHALINNCMVTVMPSKNESLSITVLESLAYGRPVLVNGDSEVLREHCILSNAGLYYYNYFEFEAELKFLINNHETYTTMSNNGRRYVEDNYNWQEITYHITELIEEVQNE